MSDTLERPRMAQALATTPQPSMLSTLGVIWQNIGPIQTLIFGVASMIPQLIKENGMPTSLPQWAVLLATAVVTVGALHTTAPRHQGTGS